MSRPTFRLDFLATTTGPDGPDQDRAPDTDPLGDVTITCTPSITHIIYPPSAPGEPYETSFIKAFKATTGADGRLKGPDGMSGIELPAADPTASPSGFSWKIETRWGGTATITKTFPAPPGGTVVDFSTVITQPANPSAELAAWTAAVTTTTSARDETLVARDETLVARDDALAAATMVIAATSAGSRTIILGDSIDAAVQGWWPYYALQSGCIPTIRNAGIGGNTTSQMLARIQADVIDYRPAVCVLGGATNDIGTGMPELTTRANIATMVSMLRKAGITPVLRTTPPADSAVSGTTWGAVPLRRQQTLRHNAWLAGYAQQEGIALLDMYLSVADPATGGFIPGITSDGIHPTEVGSKAIADYLLTLPIPSVWRGGFSLARAATDETNLVANGVFVGDANSDGLADGWITSGTATYSLTPGGNDISGNWQRCTTTTAANGGMLQDIALGPKLALGDELEIAGRIRTSGGGASTVRVSMWSSAALSPDAVAQLTQPISNGTFSMRVKVPADATKVRVLIYQSVAAGWVEVAEVTVRNRTKLGMD